MTSPDQTNPYATGAPVPPQPHWPTTDNEQRQPPPIDQSWIKMDAASKPKRKRRWPLLLLAIGGGLLLLVIVLSIGVAIGGMSGTPTAKPTTASAWDREQSAKAAAPATTTEPAAEPTTTHPTPTVRDLALRAQTTSKKCYGYGVGCSVTIKVRAEYAGPVLDPDDTWLVTYEIAGIEDGPQIGSFEMTGDTYDVNEEDVTTKSSKSKVTVKVTSIEKVGL